MVPPHDPIGRRSRAPDRRVCVCQGTSSPPGNERSTECSAPVDGSVVATAEEPDHLVLDVETGGGFDEKPYEPMVIGRQQGCAIFTIAAKTHLASKKAVLLLVSPNA